MDDQIWIHCRDHQVHLVVPIAVNNGLAITPYLKWDCRFSDTDFVITHVRSGRKLTDPCTLETASKLILDLAELATWDDVVYDPQQKLTELERKTKKIVQKHHAN